MKKFIISIFSVIICLSSFKFNYYAQIIALNYNGVCIKPNSWAYIKIKNYFNNNPDELYSHIKSENGHLKKLDLDTENIIPIYDYNFNGKCIRNHIRVNTYLTDKDDKNTIENVSFEFKFNDSTNLLKIFDTETVPPAFQKISNIDRYIDTKSSIDKDQTFGEYTSKKVSLGKYIIGYLFEKDDKKLFWATCESEDGKYQCFQYINWDDLLESYKYFLDHCDYDEYGNVIFDDTSFDPDESVEPFKFG